MANLKSLCNFYFMRSIPIYISVILVFLSLSLKGLEASSDWGTNKYIDNLSEKCVVSVAENGWIYLLHHYNSSFTTDENGWKLYLSEDGGLNFEEKVHIQYSVFNIEVVSTDMIVAGNDPANIKVYIAELTDAGESGWETGAFRIYEYDGNSTKVLHEIQREYDSSYSVSIACDSRVPATVSTPYTIAAAWSGYGGDVMEDQLHYVFSTDGGESFTEEILYSSSRIRSTDIALGSTSALTKGYFSIAFEVNSDATGEYYDIGFMMNDINNNDTYWTDPFILGEIYPLVQPNLSLPSVSLMQDAIDQLEGSDFVPLVLFVEDISHSNNHDLLMISFSPDYSFNIDQATYPDSTELVLSYPFGSVSVKQEINPCLVYDPQENNFLVTYSTKLFKELIYAGINVNEMELNEWWSDGSFRSNTGNLPENPKPHIDIDLSRGKAVFSWRDEYVNPISPSKSYFDTEWWAVDIPEEKRNELSIYPNPAKDHLNMRFLDNAEFSYRIYSMQGKLMTEEKAIKGKTSIQLTKEMVSGVYIMQLITKSTNYTTKLVVK